MAKISKGSEPTYAEGTDPRISRPTIDPMPLAVEPDEDEEVPQGETPAVSPPIKAKKTVTGKGKVNLPLKSGGGNNG